ncbi:glycosyltransferase [Skermania sp. ID1734]|uniref:glycosyltransferase family 2 protein n=1 Tax=Skermania sp. ID1734 TaxID=2597516 RepID=UPI00117C9591|nr:glycosyltransferase [Skermania sp. ID1734]TSD99488.1 glycosyltransferase [Skermania sp. ID1734]
MTTASSAAVTAVVATRNRAPELAATLDRLRRDAPQAPIIVVDNASEDDTAAVVRERISATPDMVRLVRLPLNAGAAARNIGVALAKTPYAAFCDDDSWWAADAFARAAKIFDDHPRLGLLAAELVMMPGGTADPINGALAHSPLEQRSDCPGRSVLGFIACAAIVRRNAFLEVGGFHPILHIYGEESLLAYDLQARNWDACFVPEVVAFHHPSKRRDPSAARRQREQRNAVLVALIRRPWRTALGIARQAGYSTVLELARDADIIRRERHRLPRAVEQQIRLLEDASVR